MNASPTVGVTTPTSIPIVVDLPAPFGPTNPWMLPASTVRSTPRTAFTSP
jgi:hypothetical protein